MRIATRAGLSLALVAMACASAGPPAGPASPPGAGDADAFELAPGVLVDPAAAIYLARPAGGVAALDPDSGRTLWSSGEAARPLIAGHGLLVAQRESGSGLPLAILDAADGALRQRLDLPLPEGVRAAVDESLEVRFTASARLIGDRLRIDWDYLERDVLGVTPPGGRPFARHETGAVGLDLADGEARPLAADELPAAVAEALPPPIERRVAAGELRGPLWRTGGLLAAARQIHQPGAQRLVLDRWRADTGEPLPEVTLQRGRPVAVLAAADRRHLMVVSPLEVVAGSAERYLWTIHSLASGEAVTRRRAARSATPFCLLRGLLLHLAPPSGRRVEGGWEETPLRLLALDVESGAELWQRQVRDPAFRGPAPPRS